MTQLAGNIEDLGLGEILQIISFSRKSGTLTLRSGSKEGTIVFKNGNVIKAFSNVIKEGVGDILAKKGVISGDILEKAKEIQKNNGYEESLGSILAREFRTPDRQIAYVATKLIERAVFSFFQWAYGSFVFELTDYSETPEVLKGDSLHYTLQDGLNPQFLAMEGSRLLDESRKEGAVKKEAVAMELPDGKLPYKEDAGIKAAELEDARFQFKDVLKDAEAKGHFSQIKEAQPRIAESRGLRLLKDMLSELTRPLTLNEVVLLILRFSSELMGRAVVFAVKKGNIVGLGQFGVSVEGDSPDRRIKKMSIPLNEPSILREAIDKKALIVKERLNSAPWNDYIINQLGGFAPNGAFAVPVIVQDRVAMILYGDNAPEDRAIGDISTLEIFLAQASIALERLVLRKNLDRGRKTERSNL